MADSGLSEPLRRFLGAHFNSIEQIEVLLLLRAKPDREWGVPEVSREMRSSVMSIQDRLRDLAAKGFVAARDVNAAPLYRYAPSTEDASYLIDELSIAYKQRRLAVIDILYAKPASDAASFSDAFKIVRKKGDT